jgi:hypothetical protein
MKSSHINILVIKSLQFTIKASLTFLKVIAKYYPSRIFLKAWVTEIELECETELAIE